MYVHLKSIWIDRKIESLYNKRHSILDMNLYDIFEKIRTLQLKFVSSKSDSDEEAAILNAWISLSKLSVKMASLPTEAMKAFFAAPTTGCKNLAFKKWNNLCLKSINLATNKETIEDLLLHCPKDSSSLTAGIKKIAMLA